MRYSIKRTAIAATFGCLGAALCGGAAAAQQFSAELVATGSDAEQPTQIYVSDGKLRMEGVGGKESFIITDGKAKTAYVVIPAQHMYMDIAGTGGNEMAEMFMPADPNDACGAWKEAAKGNRDGDAIATCRRVGTDTVGGRTAIKYEGTTRKGEHGFAWVDAKLNFMLKTEMAGGEGMELRNIREGAQPASLFSVPAGFQKVDMKGLMQHSGQPKG